MNREAKYMGKTKAEEWKKQVCLLYIFFFAHFCCEQEVLTNQLKNKNYYFVFYLKNNLNIYLDMYRK